MWDEEKVGIITICKLIKKQNSFDPASPGLNPGFLPM